MRDNDKKIKQMELGFSMWERSMNETSKDKENLEKRTEKLRKELNDINDKLIFAKGKEYITLDSMREKLEQEIKKDSKLLRTIIREEVVNRNELIGINRNRNESNESSVKIGFSSQNKNNNNLLNYSNVEVEYEDI